MLNNSIKLLFALVISISFLLFACDKDEDKDPTLPTVVTAEVVNIAQQTATCGGDVTDGGNVDVTARGVCWSGSENPTLENVGQNFTTDGTGEGVFTSNITGLPTNFTSYVRAYATNSEGTVYGAQKEFTTITK